MPRKSKEEIVMISEKFLKLKELIKQGKVTDSELFNAAFENMQISRNELSKLRWYLAMELRKSGNQSREQ